MRPRVLLRTHYQVDEPRLILSVAVNCASPTEAKHEDSISACLVRWARSHPHPFSHPFSLPAANYAIGNARALELVNDSHRVTATGLSFCYLAAHEAGATDPFALSASEQRLYLRQYLVASGAFVLQFGGWLVRQGATTDRHLRDSNITEELMRAVMDEYLALATEVRDRTAIRKERDRLKQTDYRSSTKRHKRYPLITSMKRLGLVIEDGETILPAPDGRLATLVERIPNAASLERLIRGDSLESLLHGIYRNESSFQAREPSKAIVNAYRFAMSKGLQACPLIFLNDLAFAFLFSVDVMSLLDRIHKSKPSELRFHVDRRGRRAFVLASDDALAALSSL